MCQGVLTMFMILVTLALFLTHCNGSDKVLNDQMQGIPNKSDQFKIIHRNSKAFQHMFDENNDLKGKITASEIKRELSMLNSIDVIQEVLNLRKENMVIKEELENMNNNINKLLSEQRTHGQDYKALYNKTVDMETKMKSLDTKLLIQQNQTTQLLKAVAVTACVKTGSYHSPVPIPFPAVITSYGIKNISSLIDNGLFRCEHSGLYIVTITLMSSQQNGYFHVYKNNEYLVDVFMQANDSNYHSGTAMVVIDLKVNDQISVQPFYDDTYIYSDPGRQSSCITIVRVK